MSSANKIQIRLATGSDTEVISALNWDVQRLHAEALPHLFKPVSADAFPAYMVLELLADPNNYMYLSLINRRALGYIYAEHRRQPETPWRYAMESLYIHHISVKAGHQARGLGNALIQAVKALAKEKGIPTIALDVWSFNTNAKGFFEKHGFVNYNVRMWLAPGDEEWRGS